MSGAGAEEHQLAAGEAAQPVEGTGHPGAVRAAGRVWERKKKELREDQTGGFKRQAGPSVLTGIKVSGATLGQGGAVPG